LIPDHDETRVPKTHPERGNEKELKGKMKERKKEKNIPQY